MFDVELFVAKVRRKALHYLEPRLLRGQLERLAKVNEYGSTSVLDSHGPVVSLTTHGARLQSVYLTLESIASGMARPSRLILWLDNPTAMADLPLPIKRLIKRGLEVHLTQNYGPHTKYFPYVMSELAHRVPLVTADDDIIYPSGWLKKLKAEAQTTPNTVVCYRAHTVGFDATGQMLPYAAWLPCETKASLVTNFATGVSGVYYPPAYLDFVRLQGEAFRQCCPRADDIWLHAMALRAGFPVRQLCRLPRHFPVIPDTQQSGLVNSNYFASGNDPQLCATYTAADLALLTSESASP